MAALSIYEEILSWSKDRPDWQRDALRRLASQSRLTDADIDELAKQCLAARGLEVATVAPVALSEAHLPQQGATSGIVTLTKLRAVKNVGTLLPDQVIEFSETGLTIIYGDNGSGKSSYARILKRLCRARGAQEGLKSNVFDKQGMPPAATIDFTVGGVANSVDWKDDGGEPAPTALSHVAVFDQLAAIAYVGDKQDASVRPAGLDLLTGLASACESVRAKIQGRLTVAKGAAQPLTGFDATTATGGFIAKLSAATTDEAIAKAAAFSEADKLRSESLSTDIARLDAEDPQRVAKELRTRRARIDSLRFRVENILMVLSPAATLELEKLRKTSETKEQAATLASSLIFGGSLPGVGGDVWRELWEAARRYSVGVAYPQKTFPVVTEDAQCVLCQQPLDAAAQQRLPKFEEFVRNTAAAEARAARSALEGSKKRLTDLQISAAEDGVLEQELDEIKPELGSTTHSALERATALRQALLNALAESTPLPSNDVFGPLVEQLRAASSDVEKRAQEALSSSDPDKKKGLQRELAELKMRAALVERKSEVVAYVQRARTVALLEKCLAEASTNAITAKNTELTKRAVTESLKTFFSEERIGLGLARTPVDLGAAGGSRGVLYHQLSLRGARADATPTNVLSEGEQRVCALASFLAESRVSETKSAIIFDDPVSSFDHLRRTSVARRLAREAVERQVIVFTHDAVFLLALTDAADEWAAERRVHHVQTYGDAAGHCSEGLPWIGMKVSTRIGVLKNESVKAEKLFKNNERTTYNALARQLYGMLREGWERAIEEVLLGDVLQRLRLSVETKKLKVVDILPTDYERIERGMTKTSAQLVGHDQPAAVNTPAPQPEELKADIADLEEWVASIRKRRDKK